MQLKELALTPERPRRDVRQHFEHAQESSKGD
jgi:hypothetical protein